MPRTRDRATGRFSLDDSLEEVFTIVMEIVTHVQPLAPTLVSQFAAERRGQAVERPEDDGVPF